MLLFASSFINNREESKLTISTDEGKLRLEVTLKLMNISLSILTLLLPIPIIERNSSRNTEFTKILTKNTSAFSMRPIQKQIAKINSVLSLEKLKKAEKKIQIKIGSLINRLLILRPIALIVNFRLTIAVAESLPGFLAANI